MVGRRNLRQIGASDKPRALDPTRARRGGAQDSYEWGAGLEPKGRQITVKLRANGGLAFGPDGSIYARVDGTILTLENGELSMDLSALVAALPITDPGLEVSTQTGKLGVTKAEDAGAAPSPAPNSAPSTTLGALATHVDTVSDHVDDISTHIDDIRTKMQAAGLWED